MIPDLRLLLVASFRPDAPLDADRLRAALSGGVTIVEGRGKGFATGELVERYRDLMAVCAEHAVPLLINDRPDIAVLLGAAGAHVGPDDLPPLAARNVLGDKWLGVSARTPLRLREAAVAQATYVGIGALRATESKPDAPSLGLARISELIRESALPAIVIGGVIPEDLPPLREAGAAGVAVASGILDASDPERAASRYRDAWA
jgi:thiamine-phosphate pyrophosphorylase